MAWSMIVVCHRQVSKRINKCRPNNTIHINVLVPMHLTCKFTRWKHFYRFCPFFSFNYTTQTGLPYFDRAAVTANENWYYGKALESIGAKLCLL